MLTVLKIIGIGILAILSFLLLILLTILFVPVRYRSKGKLTGDDRQVMVKVSYLASLISAVVNYSDGKASWAVKVLGIQILPKTKDVKKKEKHPAKEKERSDGSGGLSKNSEKETGKPTAQPEVNEKTASRPAEQQENTVREVVTDSSMSAGEKGVRECALSEEKTPGEKNAKKAPGRKAQSPKKVPAEPVPGDGTEDAETDTKKTVKKENPGIEETQNSEAEAENTEEKEDLSIFERTLKKISHFVCGIREKFHNIRVHIREKAAELLAKLKEAVKKGKRFQKFFQMEETRVTLGMLKKELKRLIRYLLPTRIRARIHFGFEDPADTGIALGAISAVYGFFPKGIDLEPDFQERVLEGEWNLRGRIRLVYFVRMALRVLLKRENRITYRRLRKLLK